MKLQAGRHPNVFLSLGLTSVVLCGLVAGGCNWDSPAQVALAEEDESPQDAEKPKHPANRLARETSPYLLLHAHNPVDWYPWGPEAFEKAKKEGKPIFLSIGYSSCYWCHVMERLSFSNPAIAKYMNENFVNIKVDREERPDVDDIYMTSCIVYFQAIGSPQGGGWPLSMFLTPKGQPFAGGTYFPPKDEGGRMGFETVLKQVNNAWTTQQEGVEANAAILTREVQRAMKPQLALEKVELERELVTSAVDELKASYDPKFGGVDFNPNQPDRPKFPVPAKLALLQYQVRRHGDKEAESQLKNTLDQLALGGIHDHLAGGFHRYSTDREWHIPHFEKMLYDQAQLITVFCEAYRRTGNALYRTTAEGICDFVLRDMREAAANGLPGGGFHSALDAETEHVEGKYYVWSRDEVTQILGEENGKLFMDLYRMSEDQSFEHGYVLRLSQPLSKSAAQKQLPLVAFENQIAAMRKQLLDARAKRPSPLKDDKILTSWNGLMIHALAVAGKTLGRPDYTVASSDAAEFVLTRMRDKNGRLFRTYRGGKAQLGGYLDDYAFLVEGLLALHRTTKDSKWLTTAQQLTDMQLKLFWDEKSKAFFFTPHDHEELIARTRNAYDSVLPSGNSVSVRNLVRLASLTKNPMYRERAKETLEVFSPALEKSPRSLTQLALALDEYLDDPDFRTGLMAPELEVADTPPLPVAPESIGPVSRAVAEVDRPGTLRNVQPTSLQEPAKKEKVEAKAYLSVDKLPPGGRCRIAVIVNIELGWHINTNPAQPDYLVATELKATTKLKSQIGNWKYPKGKVLEVEGFDEEFTVYEKRVIIFGDVVVPQSINGANEELTIEMSFQACNDARCLKPSKLMVTGQIPVARPGEKVKPINAKLFALDK